MILNGTWFSPKGYSLNILSDSHFLSGCIFLPSNLVVGSGQLKGIISENNYHYDFAFIINWKIRNFLSTTAFTGRKSKEEKTIELTLNWLLSTERLISKKKSNSIGSCTLFKSKSLLKPQKLEQTVPPYPFELLKAKNSFLLSEGSKGLSFLE